MSLQLSMRSEIPKPKSKPICPVLR